jgi:formate hydrogenlyase transcriptional activator
LDATSVTALQIFRASPAYTGGAQGSNMHESPNEHETPGPHETTVDAPPSAVDETTALRMLAEGTARATGADFFRALVGNLAAAIDVRYAFVAEFTSDRSRVRTLAYWKVDRIVDNVEYSLGGTPCEDVVRGGLCHHPQDVGRLFPLDPPLAAMGIESYLGVPLVDPEGNVLGHLAVFDERPMPVRPRRLYLFEIFAARAAAELLRIRLERQIRESEQRFRDLFEEAPIAYVFEDTATRFVHANRAAMELLGLRPEEVAGTIGMSLVAPDQSTQARIHDAFADIQQGKERGLPELELRRKDDGRPVWVRFWSRPEPDGKHTRTMIIDITARVLAEREKARLHQENLYLREEIKASSNFEEIVGRSTSLTAVLDQVRAVGPTEASVLIQGETGTGKELVARAVHSISRRRDKPLINVNCAALPAGLIESELFGHEKGAFTGAISRRIGRFELADGGTIFLDEIGELPLEMQAKLLRVLQEREIDRIGGPKPVRVDVRVIAASNRDLAKMAAEKAFRDDLYYRLNVFPILLPPLRERIDDIPLLAFYYLERFAARLGKSIQGIEPDTLRRLASYGWPGNIRELENIIERAVILCRGDRLEVAPAHLAGPLAGPLTEPASILRADAAVGVVAAPEAAPAAARSLEEVERRHILAVLAQTNWRIEGEQGAARILELPANTLRSRLKKLGIDRPR